MTGISGTTRQSRAHHEPVSVALLVVQCSWPAVALCFGALLPFVNKAFTNDDVTFLLQAQHVLGDPLHPTAFDMVFHGTRIRLSQALVTGPVMAYLLLPSVVLGGSEWAAHGVQLGLLTITIIATTSLGLRLGMDPHQARLASLILAACPAVAGMAATAMPDIAAMAFGTIGMERLTAYSQSRRISNGLASGAFLALAVLSRSHLALLILIGGWWGLTSDSMARPQGVRGWMTVGQSLIPVAVAGLLIAVVAYATRDPASGATVTGAVFRRSGLGLIALNLSSFASHWAVAFPLVVFWLTIRRAALVARCRTPIAFGVGILLAGVAGYLNRDDWWRALPIVFLTATAVVVLGDVAADARDRRDRVQVLLFLWLLIGASAAVYVQLPPKLLVPAAPAMAILIARRAWMGGAVRLGKRMVACVLAGGISLGMLINQADATQAEIGRRGGRLVEEQVHQGRRVWMDGAWGYQWYAMAAGARPLADTPPFPRAGDVVVAGLRARLVKNDTWYPEKALLYRRVFKEPGGRVQSEGAGFFNNLLGPWPWTWGTKEIGRLEVWRLASLGGGP